MIVEIAHSVLKFPNGSTATGITTGTSNGATPPVYSGVATAWTITKGPNGELPPGYVAGTGGAFPGATVQ